MDAALVVQDNNGETPLHLCATFILNDFPVPAFFKACFANTIKHVNKYKSKCHLDRFNYFSLFFLLAFHVPDSSDFSDPNNLNIVNLLGKQNKNGNSCLHTLFQSDKLFPEASIVLRALSTCKMAETAFRVNNRVIIDFSTNFYAFSFCKLATSFTFLRFCRCD